jgi:glutamine cyclotransferase
MRRRDVLIICALLPLVALFGTVYAASRDVAETAPLTTAAVLPSGAAAEAPGVNDAFPACGYRVLGEYAHDATSFTQGLELNRAGRLYEGTGLYGKSVLRELRYPLVRGASADGTVVADAAGAARSTLLPDARHFGEGITVWNNLVVQLTWKARVGYVRRIDDDGTTPFGQVERRFTFTTTRNEGWGLTHDDTELIVSDGSAYLHWWAMNASAAFADSAVMRQTRRIKVVDVIARAPSKSKSKRGKKRAPRRKAVKQLNELEYVPHRLVGGPAAAPLRSGWILANVWYDDRIACVDSRTGVVARWYDFAAVVKQAKRLGGGADVLNGIAYDAERDVVLITGECSFVYRYISRESCSHFDSLPLTSLTISGKLWPFIYEIKVEWPSVEGAAGDAAALA